MSEFDRAAANRRLEAATPGPWEVFGATTVWSPNAKAVIAAASALHPQLVEYAKPRSGELRKAAANATFMAHSWQDMREALDALDAAEGRIKELEEGVSVLRDELERDAATQPCGHAAKWLSERYCVFCEIERLRGFVLADYCQYKPHHPYAVDLRKRFPWLEAAEAGGKDA